MSASYVERDPPRAEIDAIKDPLLLIFGSNGCGICHRTEPLLETALADQSWLSLMKIEDGRGHKLGRSFRVKLWPTLIFMRNGEEVERLVRPDSAAAITAAIAALKTA